MGGSVRNKDSQMFAQSRLKMPTGSGHEKRATPRGLEDLKMDKNIKSQKQFKHIGSLGSLKIEER